MSDTVKLDFISDFTPFLETDDYNDPVYVMTESRAIKCNGILLAQHSCVLKEYLKEDKELFLTDNQHVRECLSILYGGSVKLTEENFQDILKFMVSFDIPSARDQVLDWMSQNRWNLDNARLLICSSITAIKSCVGVEDMLSLRERVYQPCRLFLGQRLPDMIDPNSPDPRYTDIKEARETFLGRLVDRKENLAMLLHADLIPEYIDWIKYLMDQSVYGVFRNALDRPEILNIMSLCTRTQFEKLFDKIENFENMTFKEYKNLNKYKLKIHEKMSIRQSLKFMKENGNLYSWWKVLDLDGMSVVPIVYTDTSDQFGIVENLLTWISTSKPTYNDENLVLKMISEAFVNMSKNLTNNSLVNYANAVTGSLQSFDIEKKFPVQRTPSHFDVSGLQRIGWFVCGDGLVSPNESCGSQCTSIEHITLTGYANVSRFRSASSSVIARNRKCNTSEVHVEFKVTVYLSPNAVPVVNLTTEGRREPGMKFKAYIYAWKLGNLPPPRGKGKLRYHGRHPDVPITYSYIPFALYTDPAEAFKILQQFGNTSKSSCINFQLLFV